MWCEKNRENKKSYKIVSAKTQHKSGEEDALTWPNQSTNFENFPGRPKLVIYLRRADAPASMEKSVAVPPEGG